MLLSIALTTTLLTTALARAHPAAQNSCPSVQQNATFDDLPSSPLAANQAVPVPYRGLKYQGFTVGSTQISTGVGVKPHSPPNIIAISILSQALQGKAELTANYQNSNTASFSLESFYFGNVVSLSTGAAAVPAGATVNITGYQGLESDPAKAKKVCFKQFTYSPPTGALSAPQAYTGTIQGCTNLQFLNITFAPTPPLQATAADNRLLLDNIIYTTKAIKC